MKQRMKGVREIERRGETFWRVYKPDLVFLSVKELESFFGDDYGLIRIWRNILFVDSNHKYKEGLSAMRNNEELERLDRHVESFMQHQAKLLEFALKTLHTEYIPVLTEAG